MVRVLRTLLPGAGRDEPDGVTAAARTIGPAVAALELLADGALDVAWDGLVHRRCRIRPARRDSLDDLGSGAGDAARPVLRSLRAAERAGWWTARAEVEVDDVLVVHELARRRSEGSAQAPAPETVAEHAAGAAVESGARDQATPARPLRAAAASSSALAGRSVDMVRVTPAAVAAWGGATGDRNAVHLRPGAALEAGLSVGRDEVVAHGLLLGAISLAVTPARDGVVDLRLLAPCAVPECGCEIAVDEVSGTVLAGGRTLLRRG